jgi:hypothetical protein
VNRGEISEQRIDASVRRVLQTKQGVGLDQDRMVNVGRISSVVATRENQMLAAAIARIAVTVLGNKHEILPLSPLDTKKIADIEVADTEDPKNGRLFHSLLCDRRQNIDFAKIDPRSNDAEYDAALKTAKGADVIICQLNLFTRSGEMTGFISRKQKEFLTRAFTLGKPVILSHSATPTLSWTSRRLRPTSADIPTQRSCSRLLQKFSSQNLPLKESFLLQFPGCTSSAMASSIH